jgi:lactate permease
MLPTIAAIPLAVFIGFILIEKRSLLFSAIFSIAVAVIAGMAFWYLEIGRILASAGKGALIATEIMLIVFGAILILEILKHKGLLAHLKSFCEHISIDKRIHVILIAWALMYFMEGVSGFGTPALIAVPIMMALGFRPLSAVSLALIGNSIAVSFGAIGLPVTYGILSSLPSGSPIALSLPLYITSLNIIGSIIMPIMLLLAYSFLEKKPLWHSLELVPFAIVIGLMTALGSIATAVFIGPELPTVIGGATALIAVYFMSKNKFLTPKTEYDESLVHRPMATHQKRGLAKALIPYIIVLVIIFISRLPYLPVKAWLIGAVRFDIPNLGGWSIDYSFSPLYSAGIIMILSTIISMIIFRIDKQSARSIMRASWKKLARPYITLVAVLVLVQIYIYSGDNAQAIHSMPILLAEGISSLFGRVWPALAHWIGALGAFTAGSATVSNLLFSGFQYQAAIASGFGATLILALQGLGAAAGNMIAPHNVVTALAVAEEPNHEADVIRTNFIPLIIYLSILSIFGLALAWFL